jgi:hypothetical protein
MQRLQEFGVLSAMLAGLVLSGCATNRSEVSLAPVASQSALAPQPSANARPIVLRTVTDARVFEVKPRDPSIPSLGFEGAPSATAEVKARAIGRKRNTYGMALGDVLLEPGDSVEQVIRKEVAEALREAGYRVVAAPASADVPVMDVRIGQFWSWIQPGFWAITIHTKIGTELVVPNRAPVMIDVVNDEATMAATDGAWIDGVRKALVRFRAAVLARKAELP